MRVLLIHSDYLKYEAKDKTKIAEEINEEMKKGFFKESLVVFTAVEKEDEDDPQQVIKNIVSEIKDVYQKVGAENIVIYPYAHLSSSLSTPQVAKQILIGIADTLNEENYKVSRAPFGWYKSFEVSCKGHPLSELSRTVGTEKEDTEEKTEGPSTQFYVFDNNELTPAKEYKYTKKSDLEKLAKSELGTLKSTEKEPPHVALMREKGLADYEPAADVGHLRWFPKGRLVRDLLSDYVYKLTTERDAMPIETPIMYDLGNEAIYQHAYKFGERQYRLTDHNKDYMLRFACCFGAFRLMADSFLTWKNLPAKVYELSTYSFRKEKRGEVVGLKRLRAFTMPDMHSFCAGMGQALEAFEDQVEMCMSTGVDLEVNYEVIFRATQDFFDENKDWMYNVASNIGKPILFEILPERKHYWVCKIDMAVIDALNRPIENPTVQIDVESGERFGITYLDEDETMKNPIVLHCSPTGSIERLLCGLLEKTAVNMAEKPPMLPVWLSPTQVRVVPIAEAHMDYAFDLANRLLNEGIRVDVDDTSERIGKKIRNAAKDWVPYTIVIGDKELESGIFNVSVRATKDKIDLDYDGVVARVREDMGDMPFRPLPLPLGVSERISFI